MIWSVEIGEIGHNLRSALDGISWELALLKTSHPYERTAFPIYLTCFTKGGRPPCFWGQKPRDGRTLLQSVPDRYWTPIERFQPYTSEGTAIDLIRNRIPVILDEESEQRWLDSTVTEPERLLPMLRPLPSEVMEAYAVSMLVNKVDNELAECVMALP